MERSGLLVMGVVIGLAVGCAPAGDGVMTNVEPPSGWEERIAAERSDKDKKFIEDPESPLLPEDRASFQGLDHWPPDPAYRLVGPLHVHEEPEQFEIPTTTGKLRPCERYGWLTFDLRGRRGTLQVYRLLDVSDADDEVTLFLPFTDATTGKETYPAGRYVDLERRDDGLYVLDFNRAYNPLCAYGAPERYICPATPRENHLGVRVEAGERGYKRESGSPA